ncbi:Hypothetical predicted protein [Mytilus galloprovincialis]|uniref:C-type lectin domain-containing protein n=1 Tax=Mytilus galloprovincialis TaxID=29158 RepID=A0A8B6G1T3_MYTGA|nr:Hypothetical predicted protein [Mytilus galloprovincialis]
MACLYKIIIVLIVYQVAALKVKVGFTEQPPQFNDIYFNDTVIFQIKGCILECVMHCNHVIECMSVSHSTASNECLGISEGYKKANNVKGYHSVGWTYHLVLDSRCPRKRHYVYSEVIKSCFRIHSKKLELQYRDFDTECDKDGAELMRIDSEEKQHLIATYLDQYPLAVWIMFQGSRKLAENHWKYNDGSIITYFNWYQSQAYSSGAQNNIVVIGMRQMDGYKWHDLPVTTKGAFLCEILVS